jgi:anti-anti-sigma factor
MQQRGNVIMLSATGQFVRAVSSDVIILDLPEVVAAETSLPDTFTQSGTANARALILNLSRLAFMDASGLGILMTLLTRAVRQRQRVLAYGVSEHYRRVFALTHIDRIIRICDTEAEALAAAGADGHGAAAAETPALSRDAAYWAQPVQRLSAPSAPAGVVNFNVAGREATGPLDGFGPLTRKAYRIRLTGTALPPAAVVSIWKERFATFWPTGNIFHGSDTHMAPGDVALLNLTLFGPIKLYTGVLVMYSDETSFSYMTCAGHMFGGLITFSAYDDNGVTTVQVQPLIRSSDPFYEITLRLGIGGAIEDRFWHQSLQNLAAYVGARGDVQQESVSLVPGVQWSKMTNIWYNAAIRSSCYMLGAPLRWLRRRVS